MNELRILGPENRGSEDVLVTDPSDPYIDAWWPPGHTVGWEHTFVHENYEFLKSVADGSRYRPDFEDGFDVQRVLNAIQTSSETGQWTSL